MVMVVYSMHLAHSMYRVGQKNGAR